MAKNCKQTTIPVVDNSTSTCGDCGYTDFECVTIGYSIPYLGILSGDSLAEVMDKMVIDIKKKTKRISDLEAALVLLTARVTALEP